MDYNELDTYNGDTIHDRYVDSDYKINIGELPDVINEADLDEYIDNLNDLD